MPLFRFRAYNNSGELAEGEINADSLHLAEQHLWTRGLTPFETRLTDKVSSTQKWWQREIFTRKKLRPVDLARFTREFAILRQSDVPVDKSLRIIGDQATDLLMKRVIAQLLDDVLNGSAVSDALKKHPANFSDEYQSVFRAGEAASRLGTVLSQLADMLERRIELAARVRAALTYPAILIVMALASTGVIVGFLVPNLVPIFAESHHPVPAGLRLVMQLADNWLLLLFGFATVLLSGWGCAKFMLARPKFRIVFDRWVLKLPLVGDLLTKLQVAKYTRTLGTLLNVGVPLMSALTSARSVLTNKWLCIGFDEANSAIRNGEGMAQAFADIAGLPALVAQMTRVGEEAHTVDTMLLRLGGLFEAQVTRQIEQFMSFLTPALTIVIAGIVGGLIFTTMNAILSINDLVMQ